jgi:diaminopimelate decarboxylase
MSKYSDLQKKYLGLWDEATKEFFANPTKETSIECGRKLRSTVAVFATEIATTMTERESYNFYMEPIEFKNEIRQLCHKLSEFRSKI